jgi:hypothetical protein
LTSIVLPDRILWNSGLPAPEKEKSLSADGPTRRGNPQHFAFAAILFLQIVLFQFLPVLRFSEPFA